jgi:hypothetical protein
MSVTFILDCTSSLSFESTFGNGRYDTQVSHIDLLTHGLHFGEDVEHSALWRSLFRAPHNISNRVLKRTPL